MEDAPVFAAPDVEATCHDDGTWLLRSRVALGPVEPNIGAVLRHWATATPDADLLCERAPDGGWRRVTYAEALATAPPSGRACWTAVSDPSGRSPCSRGTASTMAS